ncbi:hypothetical protein HDU97_009785 [Phlyctochytrium planicorne]|nr:hypothetical protein HDU97_009785 [Phlyctochytrium planicorne]
MEDKSGTPRSGLRERRQLDYAASNRGSPARSRTRKSVSFPDPVEAESPFIASNISGASTPSRRKSARLNSRLEELSSDVLESFGSSPKPRKRRNRKDQDGSGDSETSSNADNESVASEELAERDEIVEQEDDEKENLPDIAMTSNSPWSLNVKRIVQSMSPSRLLFGNRSATPSKQPDQAAEPDETIAEEQSAEQEEEGRALEQELEAEYEEYRSAELEEGELLEDEDEEKLVEEKDSILKSLTDNRFTQLMKPIFESLDFVFYYPKALAAILFDWVLLPPFSIVVAAIKFLFLTTYGQIAVVAAIVGWVLSLGAVPELDIFSEHARNYADILNLPIIAATVRHNLERLQLKVSDTFSAGLAKAASLQNSTGYLKVPELNFTFNTFNLFPVKNNIFDSSNWNVFIPFRVSWDYFDVSSSQSNQTVVEDGTANSAISARLQSLEKRLQKAMYDISSESHKISKLSSSSKKVNDGLESLTSRINQLIERFDAALSSQSSYSDNLVSSLTSAIKSLRSELDMIKKSADELSPLPKDVQLLKSSLSTLTNRFAIIETKQKEQPSFADISKHVLDIVKQHVPNMMVASVDEKSKGVKLDPAFLLHLKKQFAEAKEVQEIKIVSKKVEAAISEQVAGQKKLESELKQIAKMKPTLQNTAVITGITVEDVDKIVAEKSASFASKQEMQDLVAKAKAEISTTIDKGLQNKADKSNVDAVSDSMNFVKTNRARLEEILAGDSKDKKEVILTKAETLALLEEEFAKIRTDAQNIVEKESAMKNADTEAKTKALVEATIDAALRKYSADVIGRPDYALSSAGATVVQSLTSSSLFVPNTNWYGKLFNLKRPRGYGPMLALAPNNLPSQCWSMEGSKGRIGIHLARPIVPYAFTIDHLKRDLAYDPKDLSFSGAPRDVELWAVYNAEAFKNMDLDNSKVRFIGTPVADSKTAKPPAGVLLGAHRFDPFTSDLQTFPVRPEATKLLESFSKPPAIVVLRILSNWGNVEYTCLYRVRVHAKE